MFRSLRHTPAQASISVVAVCAFLLLALQASANQYVVESTADAGTHTLRWAILQANATPGADVITFALPGSGPHSIVPTSPLPPLTDPAGVIIDGLSQTGSTMGIKPPSTLRLQIVLDGRHAAGSPGIWILSSNNLIQGLVITRFSEDGIRIQGAAGGVQKNSIRYCIIGLDQSGTIPLPNGTAEQSGRWAGLTISSVTHAPGDAHDNIIESNIISGNAGDGIILADCQGGRVFGNTISNNYIGITLSGDVARGNGRDGLLVYGGSFSNTVSSNVIAGNRSDGIHLVGAMERSAYVRENVLTRNRIGVSPLGHPIGNALNGINIGGREYESAGGFAARNAVTSNVISANGLSGIVVWEHPSTQSNADGNLLSQNSIFNNGILPIDLGANGISLNDATDQDSGANQELNAPVILSAELLRGAVTVRGTVGISADPTHVAVEVFKYHPGPATELRGSLFLGKVFPDGGGNWTYSTTGGLLPGDSVTVIAIDRENNTSEYARVRAVTEGSGFVEPESNALIARNNAQAAKAIITGTERNGDGIINITIEVQQPCWGILEIYTTNGELVHTLMNRWLPVGRYLVEWNGSNWQGDAVPRGVYFCRFDADGVRRNANLTL